MSESMRNQTSRTAENPHTEEEGAAEAASLDPFDRLNEDILHLILPHLDIADIVHLERVNRQWRTFIRDWIERFGTALILRRVWDPEHRAKRPDRLTYKEFKGEVAKICGRQSVQSSCGLGLENANVFFVGPYYVTWSLGRIGSLELKWRPLSGSNNEPRHIRVERAFPRWRSSSQVERLTGNDDGVILIEMSQPSEPIDIAQSLVYSLTHERVLWSREEQLNATPLGNSGRTFFPLLVGQRRLYTATWSEQDQGYLLEAYDFRTTVRLYQGMIWAKGMRRYLDDRLPSLWLGSMNRQLIKCSNGEELIIRISCTMDRWLGMETDIIDGSTGHHIFAIKVPQTTLQHVLPHPNTSQVIMVSEISSCPTTSAATCRLLSRFRVFSIRRFLYEPGTDLRILYAEALLMDTNKISADQKAIAVDPCRLTAVVGYEQLVPEVGLPQWALTSYPLVLTDNVELKGAAQAALRAKSLYAGAHANVRIQRCYFLGQARKTILPPNEGNQSLLVGVGQNWLHQGQNWLHRRQGQFVAIANPVHTRPEFYTESAAMSFT